MALTFKHTPPLYTFGMLAVGATALTLSMHGTEIRNLLTHDPKADATPTAVSAKLVSLPAEQRACMVASIERTNGPLSNWQLDEQAKTCAAQVGGTTLKQQQLEAAKATLSCQ